MNSRITRFLWDLWIPEWEGERNPWKKFHATVMYYVRAAWFHGRKEKCLCYGCKVQVHSAIASGMCRDCANEDCQHEEDGGTP